MKLTPLLLALLMITACSTKRPDDAWRYNTATAFKYAEQYFLEGKSSLALSEFREAEKHAKQSADMIPLARLYLSSCALNKAVLLEDECSEYRKVAQVVNDDELKSYYALLTQSLKEEQIALLPTQYRSFAEALIKNDKASILESIADIEPLSSKMIAASLVRGDLDDATMESIISEASYFGYKRAVIAWMKELASRTKDANKAEQLKQKLSVLEDPSRLH